MGTEAAEKAMTTVDSMKGLDPRRLKPNCFETERILSVLDETIAKLELSSLIPLIIGSLDRFADLLGPEITTSLMEYKKLSDQMELLLVAAEEGDISKQEEQRVALHLLEQQLKCSVRNILRLFLAVPSLCKALKYEVWAREPATEAFIKAFREFRNFMLERLLISPKEEEETVQLVEDVSLRINKNTETITALQAELAAAIRTRDEEIQNKDNMIKDLKNSMETVDECSKDNLLQIKLEGEKQQKEELRASQAKCARLQQDIQQLEEQLNKLILEHRVSELALRKAEFEEVHAAYTKEKAELSLLMEKHAVLLPEYTQIEEERRLNEEKKKQALEKLAVMTRAATLIQAFWRGYVIRCTFKPKKKKGKGKGKGKKGKK
ncbi:dynein regulatory complex protein 10 isoform X2 [Coturnix japonica]|uniref:dynein regulatory complex protein 10 isoform X2 n=1 Tax=Coturnix japonica TaxID=93934 RepID=UPI0013A5E95A|nr:dynein regulatory complex protein 10 isoform X2 [Coturnix japonica]